MALSCVCITEPNKNNYYAKNIIHILIICLLLYILWIPIYHYKNLLSWHAILGAFAYLFLMSESIILLSNNPEKEENKIMQHGILFTIATIFAVTSLFLGYYREDREYKHFSTAHGITALVATIFTIVTLLSGLAISKSHQLSEVITPIVANIFHNLFGILTFVLGMLSLICAYFSNWIISYTSKFERIILVFITLIITSWIVIQVFKGLFEQIKNV